VAAEEQPSVDEFWRRSIRDDIFSKFKIYIFNSSDKLKRQSMRKYYFSATIHQRKKKKVQPGCTKTDAIV
jgi:hypothetical protein